MVAGARGWEERVGVDGVHCAVRPINNASARMRLNKVCPFCCPNCFIDAFYGEFVARVFRAKFLA